MKGEWKTEKERGVRRVGNQDRQAGRQTVRDPIHGEGRGGSEARGMEGLGSVEERRRGRDDQRRRSGGGKKGRNDHGEGGKVAGERGTRVSAAEEEAGREEERM